MEKVVVEKKDGEIIEGLLMPNSDEKRVVVKLGSGYNVGINKENIKSMKKEKAEDKKSGKSDGEKKSRNGKKEKSDEGKKSGSGKPKIAILHTGGTIASRVDYVTGGVYAAFTPEDLKAMVPEISELVDVDSELIANMWSDDLRFKHFDILARAVEKKVKEGVKGIIIGMGTDNLAVASAGLAFVLEKVSVPVLFVGAQRSSDRGSSDAAMNLLCGVRFILETDFAGVGLCMHEGSEDKTCAILPGTKTRKMHSSRRDAFRPVNDTIIARVHYEDGKIEYVKKDYPRKEKEKEVIVKSKMEEKVGFLKIHMHMIPEQFSLFKGFKGLVIEGTGLGHTPGHVPTTETAIHKKMFPILKEIIDSGCVVVMTTGCLYGRVDMNIYSKGRDLLELGVVPGEDMLPETAFVKLAWLLGNYKRDEALKLVGENLRGEITDRTLYEEDFMG